MRDLDDHSSEPERKEQAPQMAHGPPSGSMLSASGLSPAAMKRKIGRRAAKKAARDPAETKGSLCSGKGCSCENCAGGKETKGTTTVFGSGSTKTLGVHGETKASYKDNYEITDQKKEPSKECDKGCPKGQCVHVTGNLKSTFTVTTQIKLPSVSQYPGLTECQKKAVQTFINTTLKEHEQKHAAAFAQYNGEELEPVDETGCISQLDPKFQARHTAKETQRKAAADLASRSLDPYDVDIPGFDCGDKQSADQQGAGDEDGSAYAATEPAPAPDQDDPHGSPDPTEEEAA